MNGFPTLLMLMVGGFWRNTTWFSCLLACLRGFISSWLKRHVYPFHSIEKTRICEKTYRVWVGQIFEFVKLILFWKIYLLGGLAPSCQTVGSLWYSLAREAGWEIGLSITTMDSTNLKIWPTQPLPKTCVNYSFFGLEWALTRLFAISCSKGILLRQASELF